MKPDLMKRFALLLALTAPASIALAQEYRAGALVIDRPWTRATPAGAKVAAGYAVIRNTGNVPDRLTGGTVEVADHIEIHEMAVENDIMRMRPLPDGLEIRSDAATEIKPGGYHIMMMDLKRPLKQGEVVKGILTFEKAGTVPVEFAVQSIGAQVPPGQHEH
ncbi:copper chaperone PCu(A)C [Methylobacterium sp. 092160098-2]|uniref:copper chaperone PCu(A)C n=1 Tax=Methylobacterium sp. 092160098-2 TaxID=3025129 RepID=UPI002381C3A1|nr:copper chaperone PCu(A)C [Methylobacterium sp. 092160098-2]MDE4916001.1 copper chaperone PCu(A)C [Methylobacterium sp. 092160098-2]